MKKIAAIIAAVLLIGGAGIFIYSTSIKKSTPQTVAVAVSQAPQAPDVSVKHFKTAMELEEIGFKKVLEVAAYVTTKEEMKWNEIGLNFYSDDEFEAIIQRENLLVNHAVNYTGTIPTEKQQLILDNLKKLLASSMTTYAHQYDDGRLLAHNMVIFSNGTTREDRIWEPSKDRTKIVRIAYPREDGIDPIVVVKADGGWVELARW